MPRSEGELRVRRAAQATWHVVRTNPGATTAELVPLVLQAWKDRGIPFRPAERTGFKRITVRDELDKLDRRNQIRKVRTPSGVLRWYPIPRHERQQ